MPGRPSCTSPGRKENMGTFLADTLSSISRSGKSFGSWMRRKEKRRRNRRRRRTEEEVTEEKEMKEEEEKKQWEEKEEVGVERK